jgi:hypothetical protein
MACIELQQLLPDGWSKETLVKILGTVSLERRIQARHEKVAKFIEGEGKARQEKAVVGLAR